jgi:hypothetical protein
VMPTGSCFLQTLGEDEIHELHTSRSSPPQSARRDFPHQ